MSTAGAGPEPMRPSDGDADLEKEIAEAIGDQSIEDLIDASTAPPPTEAKQDDTAEGDATTDDKPEAERPTADLMRGRIAAIRGEDVFVDLHGVDGKHQGVVPLSQFERQPRVGSIMDFVLNRFDQSEGLYILSREGVVGRLTLEQLHKGASTECRVTGSNKGGLEVEITGGIKAFMPASQVDLGHIEDLDVFIGQKVPALVVECDLRHKKIVLSRKRYLERDREKNKQKLWESLEVGQVRDGKVSRVTDFGAFIDLGGADGLCHVSDMSYERVENPADVLKIGDSVSVKVLKLEAGKGRISLGLKQTMANPWETVGARIHVGEAVTGRVKRLMDFGAFVEIEPGVEGMLHISEMSWKRIGTPKEVVQEGDSLKLMVLSLDPVNQKMSLSLKQAKGDPWAEAGVKYAPGSVVEGKVTGIRDFGAFVELETGVEGMVHISQLAYERVPSVEKVLQIGDAKQFKVLELDEDKRRISLSLKATLDPPEGQAAPEPVATPAKPRKRRTTPGSGGLGESGALGTGLGDLKL